MKLIIDTKNGISGDIVTAGLIGLGADQHQVIFSMEYAGNHIGITTVDLIYDGVFRIDIKIETDYGHLHESKARTLLEDIVKDLKIKEIYNRFAMESFARLCEAERYVHSHDKRLRHMLHHHHHEHNHDKDSANDQEALLHEAKDIFIDVVGLSVGLQELGIKEVYYLDSVNVGSGKINFSHGEFEVPAPATEYLLNNNGIYWKKSDSGEESATPTGISILVGCRAKRIENLEGFKIIKKVSAKGTRALPPVDFYLAE